MKIYLLGVFTVGVLLASVMANVADDNINEQNGNEDLEIPCGSSNIDDKCVREYFGNHGRCEVINHPDSKPVRRNYHVSYLPSFNTTVIDTQSSLTQLNGIIKKFYINKKTGNLVMSVHIKACIFESKLAYFYFHRKGQEPLVLSDTVCGTHPPTDLTAMIPLTDGMITRKSLQNAFISAYLYEAKSPKHFGSIVSNSKDPVVVAVISSMMNREGLLMEEVFLTQARSNFMGYLQKYVCDFRVPPS